MHRSSSAWALTAALVAAGSLVAPSSEVAAQQLGSLPTEDQLVERLEALRPLLDEARAEATAAVERQRAERERASGRPSELVRVGPMRIVAPPERVSLAQAAFDEVWRRDFHALTGSPSLEGEIFVFQWAWRRYEPLRPDREAVGSGPIRRVELTRGWVRTRAGVRLHVRNAIWSVLLSDAPDGTGLKSWLGPAPYPYPARIARGLTQAPSEAALACLDGDLESCTGALGLSGAPAELGTEARALVVLEAVRLGGEGGWGRLIERPDAAPLDALAYAAGTDGPSVVAAWRETVLAARPEIHAGLGGQAGRALLWILMLVAFAARSTRWRLG